MPEEYRPAHGTRFVLIQLITVAALLNHECVASAKGELVGA